MRIKKCYICGFKKRVTRHHKEPLGLGGLDIQENIVKLCWDCHKNLHHQAKRPYDLMYMKKRLERLKQIYGVQ